MFMHLIFNRSLFRVPIAWWGILKVRCKDKNVFFPSHQRNLKSNENWRCYEFLSARTTMNETPPWRLLRIPIRIVVRSRGEIEVYAWMHQTLITLEYHSSFNSWRIWMISFLLYKGRSYATFAPIFEYFSELIEIGIQFKKKCINFSSFFQNSLSSTRL